VSSNSKGRHMQMNVLRTKQVSANNVYHENEEVCSKRR